MIAAARCRGGAAGCGRRRARGPASTGCRTGRVRGGCRAGPRSGRAAAPCRADRGSVRRSRRRRRPRAGSTGRSRSSSWRSSRARVSGRAARSAPSGSHSGCSRNPGGRSAGSTAQGVGAGQPALVAPGAVGSSDSSRFQVVSDPRRAGIGQRPFGQAQTVAPPTGCWRRAGHDEGVAAAVPTESSHRGVPPRDVPTRRNRGRADGGRRARPHGRPARPRSDSGGGAAGHTSTMWCRRSPVVHGVRTVSHGSGGTSTHRRQRRTARRQARRSPCGAASGALRADTGPAPAR